MSRFATTERADVVVVGARCAGSAAAITLARAGRRVVALDRASFPSETLSTHLLWPSSLAELQALGALPGVLALGAPRLPIAIADGAGRTVRMAYTPVDGIDYAMCVRRIGMDATLVGCARRVGVDVRERASVTELIREDGRVAGVRYRDADDEPRELRAKLVIGADGRRSTVARLVGASEPFYRRTSGRACYYAYWEDAKEDWRHIAAQWREGAELGTAFPCDDGLTLVLLQTPATRVPEYKGNLVGTYRDTVAAIPGLARRLEGSTLASRVRSATGIEVYFRSSVGPGWALPGDAGHFKDPVTAQGIRDALRYGRLLGEAAAPVLDEPVRLQRALAAWERRRLDDCLEVLQWTDGLARGEALRPVEVAYYRAAARNAELGRAMLEVFSRVRRPGRLVPPALLARITAGALVRGDTGRRAMLRSVREELETMVADAVERRRVLRAGPPPLMELVPAAVKAGDERRQQQRDGQPAAQ